MINYFISILLLNGKIIEYILKKKRIMINSVCVYLVLLQTHVVERINQERSNIYNQMSINVQWFI